MSRATELKKRLPVAAETTEERTEEMLGVLPPVWLDYPGYVGFGVGEPSDHRLDAFGHFGPTRDWYLANRGKYWTVNGTRAEAIAVFDLIREGENA